MMWTCHSAVILALLVHDLAWISSRPEAGLPAMTAGLILQTVLVWRERVQTFEFINQLSLLLWLVGNIIWTLSEYMWDDKNPAGFLRDFAFLDSVSGHKGKKLYAKFMLCAVSVMLATSIGLSLYYLVRWLRRAAPNGRSLTVALGECEEVEEDYIGIRCLTVPVYYELFSLPWILMDTSWGLCNFLLIVHVKRPVRAILHFAASAGALAIAVQFDCMRRRLQERHHFESALCLAELLWVAGNQVWMLEDLLTDDSCHAARAAAMGMFALGALVTVVAAALDAPPPAQGTAALAQCTAASPLLGVEKDLEASASPASPATPSPASPTRAESPLKKRWRTGHPKKASRLTKGVVVLRDAQMFSPERVAGLALRELGADRAPLLLLDLGRVRSGLAERRGALPRVAPQLTVGRDADSKTVQLLHSENCRFTCTNLPEVRLLISLGVSPQDIFFAQPHKPRPHIAYMRERGVGLLSFEDEAELRKIAVEHPSARLLLSVTCPDADAAAGTAPLSVPIGARRGSWQPLLSLAASLGLRVAGVSLSAGPRRARSLHSALEAASEALELAVRCGFAPSVLDLGGELEDICAAHAAEMLDRWLPPAAWPHLRLLAEPGAQALRGAASLLTPHSAQWGACDGGEVAATWRPHALHCGKWGAFVDPRGVEPTGAARGPDVSSPSQKWLLWRAAQRGRPLDEGLWPAVAAPGPTQASPAAAGEERRCVHVEPTVWYYMSVEDDQTGQLYLPLDRLSEEEVL